ncbi:MAG: hypothetical protein WEA80_04325 [Gemmatimonadaceae bacterium]
MRALRIRCGIGGAAAMLVLLLCAAPAHAQRVRLEIRPQVGDTIHMQLDQEIEVSGTSPEAAGAPQSMTGSAHVRTRAIPLRRLASGTRVLAVTDSMEITPVGGKRFAAPRSALAGATVTMIVGHDGGMRVLDTGEHDGETTPFFPPAAPMLPDAPVNVRGRWARTLELPIGTRAGETARVQANFRLDSLSGNGDIAYISMTGTLTRIGGSGGRGGSQRSTGTLAGFMQLDRRLGWITDTHLVLNVRTVMTSGEDGTPPVQVQMKVTQRLRAMRGS